MANFSKVADLESGATVGVLRKAKHKSRVCKLEDTENNWLVKTTELLNLRDKDAPVETKPPVEVGFEEQQVVEEVATEEEQQVVEEFVEEASPAADKTAAETPFQVKLPRHQLSAAFNHLDRLLKDHPVKTTSGATRTASAGEFMWMGRDHYNFHHFKHSGTRNYVYITADFKLYVPEKDGEMFQEGTFDWAG